MSLRHSYTVIAPFYDLVLTPFFGPARARSLAPLAELPAGGVLIDGAGTGLDLPHLPPHHHYTALDLTPAMLRRCRRRAGPRTLQLVEGDSQHLPFADASFDYLVLHLILAVVPEPRRCLAEAARVLRPGGQIFILDKFLKPGEAAPVRRLLNPFSRRLATRLDVIFEQVHAHTPELECLEDRPALAGGWFRHIRLRKRP